MSKHFDSLESRQLLSASTSVTFNTFSSTSGLYLNGWGKAEVVNKNALLMTDGGGAEARSAWWNTAVGIGTFDTSFSFQIDQGVTTADGITFALQNKGTGALGTAGDGVGIGGVPKSFAVAFDMYNYDFNRFESDLYFLVDGANTTQLSPISLAPLNLHLGDRFACTVSYDGTTVDVLLKDLTRNAEFRTIDTVDLHTI